MCGTQQASWLPGWLKGLEETRTKVDADGEDTLDFGAVT